LVAQLAGSLDEAQNVAIAVSQGRDHPVFGLWPLAMADDLESWLLTDEKHRVRDFLARHPVRKVEFSMIETTRGLLDPFFNINTPDDLAQAEQWLKVLPR
jgi:molybdopterin-guanine dinucleotide biosynthesis protein A